jgi:hypothetical protein
MKARTFQDDFWQRSFDGRWEMCFTSPSLADCDAQADRLARRYRLPRKKFAACHGTVWHLSIAACDVPANVLPQEEGKE